MCRLRKVGMEGDVACGAHALGWSCVGGERVRGGRSRRRMQMQILGHATMAIVKALRRSKRAMCAVDVPFTCLQTVAFQWTQFPKSHGPTPSTMTIEPPLSVNFSRLTDDLLPATATRTPAAKLSTPRKPTSQWPSNRSLAYVLPLDLLAGREQETNDWDRCSAVRSCSTSLLPWVRLQSQARRQSFLKLQRSSGPCARSPGVLG